MADKKEPDNQKQKYVNDPRIACKYGTTCYQKNPAHQQKYKHPPPKIADNKITQPKKRFKMDDGTVQDIKANTNPDSIEDNEVKDDDHNVEVVVSDCSEPEQKNSLDTKNQESEQDNKLDMKELGRTPKDFNLKDFIKEKFLVEMPEDFYKFWDICKVLKERCPEEALKDVGLTLVGPYDVLAGKFYDVSEQPAENYLIHWRYFHDPPEFQTVLKGDDRTGFHIGYFRDSPKELPVYLAGNFAKTDGIFKVMGDNIFAAVYLHLEDLKKTGDPFKKIYIGKFQSVIKKKADELNLDLSEKTQKVRDRDKKIVTRSFSKMGIIVPYNRRTQVGYRDLSVTNKELIKLLDNIQKALPEQRQRLLSDLQNILTNVSIATDECDFGTGIELGLDILAHGVETLNQTVARFLATNYKLIGREEFAKIAEAHMKNRRKGTNLSIL